MDIINQMYGHIDINALSKYYDISSYNNYISSQKLTKFTIMHINFRSLSKNSDNIQSFFKSLYSPPDVLAVTKTWLTENNKHLHEITGYRSYHLVRNTQARGGVSVYISDFLNSE